MNDNGTTLYRERTRAVDIIVHVENLVNSIANHPKEFDAEIAEIRMNRESFISVCEFAKKELEAAKKSALSAGAGVAVGNAFLALAGPVGWGIAGVTLLSSIVLFSVNKVKLAKRKKEEIEAIKYNTHIAKKVAAQIQGLIDEVSLLRDNIGQQYESSLRCFDEDFTSLSREQQMQMGVLVNSTKALAASLSKSIQ